MGEAPKQIIIIGGGITGLSAAFYMRKLLDGQQMSAEITLIEKSSSLGGKIKTLRRDGFLIEQGPDSFMARKQPILDLTRELGLEPELVAANPKAKANYILHKGRLHQMPMGLMLGIPTEVTPFMKTGLGDAKALSLQATFPQFRQLEQRHRSLILGMLASKKQAREMPKELPEIARRSLFLTFKGGLGSLIERLDEQLCSIRRLTGQAVKEVRREGQRYRVRLEHGEELQADGVIMALPAYETAVLLEGSAGMQVQTQGSIQALRGIPYVSVANIALAFKPQDIKLPLSGFGFVVPRSEGRLITACTWTSSKWLHTAPNGHVLLRAYIGHAGAQAWAKLTDRELLDAVRQDLQAIMGIKAEPLFTELTRWERSMPQYPVGHLEQLARLREGLAASHPGLWLCGSGYEGVGLPDCIGQGRRAAEALLLFFKQ
ncbi:protoporphyrinogen oxidase [Paenibacillus algorifonticola]